MARSSAPSRLLTSEVLTPGATRSSVDCGTPSSSIFSMPSAGITFSMPATVICNSPSRRPPALRPRVPAATAIRSPCWIRDCTISTRPPAAWISRNRSGQGFGVKSFRPLSSVRTSASNGCRQQRMQLLHAALLDLQHGLDHGAILRRAFGEAAVQFDQFGARQRRLHRSIDAVDRGVVEHDGAALRNGGQSDHAAAGLAPVHHHRGRPAAIGNRRRRGEFRDQQFRIPDLRHDQDLAEARGDGRLRRGLFRGLRAQRHAGAAAADFEAERKAGHRAPGAVIDPAGFRFLGAPGIGLDLDLGGGKEPECAPRHRGDQRAKQA